MGASYGANLATLHPTQPCNAATAARSAQPTAGDSAFLARFDANGALLQSTYLGILPGFINGTRWRRSARDRRKVQALGDVRHLATLMLNQGCRPEELRELPQAHVDLAKATLTIGKGKSDAARRSLPLTAESRFVLAARLSEPSRWVFPSRRGQGHICQHQRLWESIIRRAQLEGLVMYDLRHTCATRAACSCLS